MERRRFSKEHKQQVANEALSGVLSKAAVARKYTISDNMLERWIAELMNGKLTTEQITEAGYRERIARLEQMVGRQAMEIEFLKKVHERIRLQEQQKERLSKSVIIPVSRREGGAS